MENQKKTPKVIAFYLPQYHPTTNNDKWWGKGFTEWTNVGKAKSLFRGHYQPKVPRDLGYYDLRLPEIREAQASMAEEAGLYGFCYYHYWFGNGNVELDLPFKEVLETGKPDYPFMLCWANESWHKKFWDKDGKGSSKEVLVEQTYPGKVDIEKHFYYVLSAFKDTRYIRHDNKPVFMIYNPLEYPERRDFIRHWQALAKLNGLDGITFICQLRQDISEKECISLLEDGFDYINTVRLWDVFYAKRNIIKRIWDKINRVVLKLPKCVDFKNNFKLLFTSIDKNRFILPTLIPNWDHTPRSGVRGTVLTNATPELFQQQCDFVLSKSFDKPFVFLKSWNEWGEGNYMEPDLKYKSGYIEALKASIDKLLKIN